MGVNWESPFLWKSTFGSDDTWDTLSREALDAWLNNTVVHLTFNAAVRGWNPTPPQPTANCLFLDRLPPGLAKYRGLASEGLERY
jgi:hypothetical protein